MANIKEEMEPLLQKIFEEGLTKDEEVRFQKLVKESSEAKQLYLDYCQMHAMLQIEQNAHKIWHKVEGIFCWMLDLLCI